MVTVQPFIDDNILLDEDLSNDYEPDEAEIRDYALYLGMKLPEDNDLLYLAKEGLKAPLPAGWKAHRTKEDEIFYLHEETGQKTWEHPCDEFYRKQYFQMKALTSRTGGKREEQKHMKQLQMQQKLMLSSNIQLSTGSINGKLNVPTSKAENPGANLNYSTNISNFCDHSILINQYNRGNDSTVIKGSPVFERHEQTPSPIGNKKGGSNATFFNSGGSEDILPKDPDGDELSSLSKCDFDEFKELDEEDELEKLNAACNEFNHDELEDHIPSKDEKKSHPERFMSENDEESLNLSEFNLEFECKSRREPSRADCYTNRGPKSQRQQAVDTYREREVYQQKLQKEIDIIDKEYEERLATFNQELNIKFEEFQKEKNEIFEEEKLRMEQNFREELERLKQELNEENESPVDEKAERAKIEHELKAQIGKLAEESKQQIEQEYKRKEISLETSGKEAIQIQLEEQEKEFSTIKLKEKQEILVEIETIQKKLKDFLSEQESRTEKLAKLARDHEKEMDNIKLEMNKKLRAFETTVSTQLEEELRFYKDDLNQELEYQRALASGELRRLEEEVDLLQKDIQQKYLEDFEYDKQRMTEDLTGEMEKYWSSEQEKITEELSVRTDVDKNNEIRRKINEVEVEQLVYQQTLKRKLEEVRFQTNSELNKQIELINEQGAQKEQDLERLINELNYQIEEARQIPQLIQEFEEQMIGLENNLLQKDEKEAALIEEIQELSNKIPENESLLNSLNEQLSSPEIADFRAAKKKELLSAIDSLQKTIETKNKEIARVKQGLSMINIDDSFNNPNKSISYILKEIDNIKQTLKSQNRQNSVPHQRPLRRENVCNRTFLLNNTIDNTQNHNQSTFSHAPYYDKNRSIQYENQDGEDENEGIYDDKDNLNHIEKINRDLSCGSIKSKSIHRDNSANHTKSLHQIPFNGNRNSDNIPVKKPASIILQSNIKFWREIIVQEMKKLEVISSELKERKVQVKKMQDDIREEQERYKTEHDAYKLNPVKFHGKKAGLEAFKRGLNENIKKYNDILTRLREDEKDFKEKKLSLTTIKETVDSFEEKSCWNDLELQKYYSKYKESKLNARLQNEIQEKNKENRETNLTLKTQIAQQSAVLKSVPNSKDILKTLSGKTQLKEGCLDTKTPNKEPLNINRSFDGTRNKVGEAYKSQTTNPVKKTDSSLDYKLLNQKEGHRSLQASNPQLEVIKTQIEIQKNIQNRIYSGLASRYGLK